LTIVLLKRSCPRLLFYLIRLRDKIIAWWTD